MRCPETESFSYLRLSEELPYVETMTNLAWQLRDQRWERIRKEKQAYVDHPV